MYEMKNRTLIGVICMVLAIVMTFAVAPIINKFTSDTTEVVRLKENIVRGGQISGEQLEKVSVRSDTLPEGTLEKPSEVVGKYAASDLYKGDCLTKEKLSGEANTASDAFASLDGTKVAVSVTIDTFASGLSGKLANGDVISLIVTDDGTGKAEIPGALKYLKVITTTTAGGIDQDSIVRNEDGSYEIPSTVTVLANVEQAKLLAECENSSDSMTAALVYRGTVENANKFLAVQDKYFETKGDGATADAGSAAAETASGSDSPAENASGVINGNAGYYHMRAGEDNG